MDPQKADNETTIQYAPQCFFPITVLPQGRTQSSNAEGKKYDIAHRRAAVGTRVMSWCGIRDSESYFGLEAGKTLLDIGPLKLRF